MERGDKVEVCSKQQGLEGSYLAATVINQLDNSDQVRYKRHAKEDATTALKEVVSGEEIRPSPTRKLSKMMVNSLAMYDEVDAFDSDGWWARSLENKGHPISTSTLVFLPMLRNLITFLT